MSKPRQNNTDLEQAVKNYSSQIITLEKTSEQIRQNKGMYIGSRYEGGILNMYREVLQNAFDQIVKPDSPADSVWITIDDPAFAFTVEDNGLGIPMGNIIRVATAMHTSKNFKKTPGEFPSGMHGVGLKITNALSERMVISTYQLGKASQVEFIKGEPTSEEYAIENPGKQGTIISFAPDLNEMKRGSLLGSDFIELTRQLTMLQPLGTKVHIKWNKLDGTTETVELMNKEGINVFMRESCPNPIFKDHIYFSDMNPEMTMKCEVAINYDTTPNSDIDERVYSFANGCITSIESEEVKGLYDGLCDYFRDYMNKTYLAKATQTNTKKKKKSIVVKSSDIRVGLRAVVNVAAIDAEFAGQSKERLTNQEMRVYVKAQTKRYLSKWSEDHIQALQILCRYFKTIAELRASHEEGKTKAALSASNSGMNGKPKNYCAPTESYDELFIVEGDSAGGHAKVSRHAKTQGILPVRGKGLNCWGKDPEECYRTNAEVKAFADVVGGGGVGKKFDITKVKWKKIIFAADADAAGKHIDVLLLLQCLVLFPGLVESGRVYKAVPPLYRVNNKRGKEPMFFPDEITRIQYCQKDFCKNHTITKLDGTKLKSKEITELFEINEDYLDEMSSCTNIFHVDPNLLEMYLFNRDLQYTNPKKLGELIKKDFRFIEYERIGEYGMLHGSVNGTSNFLFMTPENETIIKDVARIIDKNPCKYYLLDGQRASIYDIMKMFNLSKPNGLQRLKGLGEQSAKELAETVILPGEYGGNRVLCQYTVTDIAAALNHIREIESDKYKLIKLIGRVSKSQIIE